MRLADGEDSFALPSKDQQILAIAPSRCGRDYCDEERDLLALTRPHLIQAYRNALDCSGRARVPWRRSGSHPPRRGSCG